MATADESSRSALDAARQHRRGVRAAMGEVERSLAKPARAADWGGSLEKQLQTLSVAFEHHVRETEDPDGLFEEILAEAPRLNHRVDQLREEHSAIQTALGETLAAFPADGILDDDRITLLRENTLSVLGAIVRHRHLGSDLVFEAYSVDIEAAD